MFGLIAYSINDPAGRGTVQKLRDLLLCRETALKIPQAIEVYDCERYPIMIAGFKDDVLYFDFLEFTNANFILIVSRHSAKSAIPTLTTHTPGNPSGNAFAGGKPWELPPSNPILQWFILKNEIKYRNEFQLNTFEVTYEVTHHGPTSLSKPVTFAEIGSTIDEWNNDTAQKALAYAIQHSLHSYFHLNNSKPCIISIGFGGPHYAPTFTKRALKNNECYGHIISSYILKELDIAELEKIVKLTILKTPQVERIVIEKLRSDIRKVIEKCAKEFKIEIVKA